MKRISLGALSIATSAVAIAFVVWLIGFFGPGGFADGKAILARLQGMELEHRNQKITTPEVFAEYKDTGPIVVLGTTDPSFPYAWLAVTVPSCDGQLCMVSANAPIDVTCKDIHQLTAHMPMAPTVERMLTHLCH